MSCFISDGFYVNRVKGPEFYSKCQILEPRTGGVVSDRSGSKRLNRRSQKKYATVRNKFAQTIERSCLKAAHGTMRVCVHAFGRVLVGACKWLRSALWIIFHCLVQHELSHSVHDCLNKWVCIDTRFIEIPKFKLYIVWRWFQSRYFCCVSVICELNFLSKNFKQDSKAKISFRLINFKPTTTFV